jgi:hypothetical protein
MKIIALMAEYNESLFIEYVLNSIYDFVDEIIIIDSAMKSVVDRGGSLRSTDGTIDIIKKWQQKNKKIHIILPNEAKETPAKLCEPGLDLAKELKGDWLMTCCGDEIWPKNILRPLRKFLKNCDNNNILGVNFNMNYFAPDFWHFKEFYGPRLSKITPNCSMPFITQDVLYWPEFNSWQSIELNKVPEHVRKMNIDYPKFLKVFHYSCVGYERVKFKYDFYKFHKDNIGSSHNKHYMDKNWNFFKKTGYKDFTGKHPKLMLNHKLYNEKLY